MKPMVPERKVGSSCQLETEMASLAQAVEHEEDDEEDDEVADADTNKLETTPLSTTLLASTPASLFSTPGATEIVMCGAVSFFDVFGSKAA